MYQENLRLGRKKAADPRDRDYRAADHIRGVYRSLPETLPRIYRYHKRGPQLDQGPSSRCVVFAIAQLIQSGPIMQDILRTVPQEYKMLIGGDTGWTQLDQLLWWAYKYAQDHDEWDGAEPLYYGTSGRAGAKAFQHMGYITNYFWLWSVEEIAQYVLHYGPVPVGTDWFSGMDTLDERGFIHPTGWWRGGHEWLIDGVNTRLRVFRMRNSWGSTNPHAWITFDDMDYLLKQGGDALALAEIRLPKQNRSIQIAELR